MANPADVMNAMEKKIKRAVCMFMFNGSFRMAKAVNSAKPPVISQ
jgi:hypothetical protein